MFSCNIIAQQALTPRYLRSNAFQVPLTGLIDELPDTMPSAGIFVVDLSELFNALIGSVDSDAHHTGSAMERICKHLQIDFGGARNAGTNAQVCHALRGSVSLVLTMFQCTLQALQSMASGLPLDAQREQRWPDQTEVQVRFKAWEADHTDLEGLFPATKIC